MRQRSKNRPVMKINNVSINPVLKKVGWIERFFFGSEVEDYVALINCEFDKKQYNRLMRLHNNPDIEAFKIVPVFKKGVRNGETIKTN